MEKTTREKVNIALDVYGKLNELHLMQSEAPAIRKLKEILNKYVKNEQANGPETSGVIPFPEVERSIVYYLPYTKSGKAYIKLVATR